MLSYILFSAGKSVRLNHLLTDYSAYSIFTIKNKFDMPPSVGFLNVLFRFFTYNKVSKVAKIRNRYNQVPHLTQDTNGKVTNSKLDTTNENQEVSSFPAGDQKAQINRHAQRHNKNKIEKHN